MEDDNKLRTIQFKGTTFTVGTGFVATAEQLQRSKTTGPKGYSSDDLIATAAIAAVDKGEFKSDHAASHFFAAQAAGGATPETKQRRIYELMREKRNISNKT